MSADWIGTYRLQLHAGFPLSAAQRILTYLADLGMSHVYLSPCLQAAPGSTHGYDVINPEKISDELGGEDAWQQFVTEARAQDLKILLDIVPNHMAAAEGNPWWDDLLALGPYSRFASYFDLRIDPGQRWQVHLCVLARPYGEAVEAGELTLELKDGAPRLRHYSNSWPLGPASWGPLLEEAEVAPLFRELEALAADPVPGAGDRARFDKLVREVQLLARHAERHGRLQRAVERIQGDHERLHRMLQRQFYVLHGWKLAGELCNYRRFFDIDSLVGIRTERPEVFRAVHERVRAMIAAGEIDGLRIDHPDGLRDPRGYFERLRGILPDGKVYVEKILENDERLNEDWPVDGTVGYEFMANVNRLWMDDRRTDALTAIYSDFTGHSVNFAAVVRDEKRRIVESNFFADVEYLGAALLTIARSRWQTCDLSPRQLRAALARLTTALTVYRTYRSADVISAEDRRLISEAVQSARIGSPEIDASVFDFLGALLTADSLNEAEANFVARWQQLAPAVMAKGVEDTIFYLYDRLVSCNEVGAQASLIGISAEKFHEFCNYLGEHWPSNLLTTSTHDNKRSEDVRTRISVISEIPDRWAEAVHQWSQLNAPAWQNRIPDRHAEYLLYQTLVGAWPISRERCWRYMQKACREAKIVTSWHEPNVSYEKSIQDFIDGIFASTEFIASLERFVEPLVLPGRINSLAQTLIKMVAPGVPDFYQGTELWDLSLVDPDNRRAVDFQRRSNLWRRCRNQKGSDVLGDWDSGQPKLWLISRTLRLRYERPQDFAPTSGYQPLVAQGSHLTNVLAFQRGENLIAMVPRFTLTLNGEWGDTRLPLPPGRWAEAFGSGVHEGEAPAASVFASFPVALLVRESA
jgi:(1->4)-alpha-D-glucan 1-alpha-D-glucosylmutase